VEAAARIPVLFDRAVPHCHLHFTARFWNRYSASLFLAGRPASQPEAPGSWRRLQLLIWFLVSLAFLPGVLLGLLIVGVPFPLPRDCLSFVQSDWFSRLSPITEEAIVLGVALCIMGRDGRESVRSSIRLPDLRSFLLAVAFPTSIDVFISSGQYVLERAQWAAHDFGRLGPPQFGLYFKVPDILLLLLIFGAFFEEVIFRGFLQTRFIHGYGLYRGIFLVGVIWAAFHFFSDFSFSSFTDQEVLAKLGFRMFMCVALSFVLAWLTLRSQSVVPAAVSHARYNALVFFTHWADVCGEERVASRPVDCARVRLVPLLAGSRRGKAGTRAGITARNPFCRSPRLAKWDSSFSWPGRCMQTRTFPF